MKVLLLNFIFLFSLCFGKQAFGLERSDLRALDRKISKWNKLSLSQVSDFSFKDSSYQNYFNKYVKVHKLQSLVNIERKSNQIHFKGNQRIYLELLEDKSAKLFVDKREVALSLKERPSSFFTKIENALLKKKQDYALFDFVLPQAHADEDIHTLSATAASVFSWTNPFKNAAGDIFDSLEDYKEKSKLKGFELELQCSPKSLGLKVLEIQSSGTRLEHEFLVDTLDPNKESSFTQVGSQISDNARELGIGLGTPSYLKLQHTSRSTGSSAGELKAIYEQTKKDALADREDFHFNKFEYCNSKGCKSYSDIQGARAAALNDINSNLSYSSESFTEERVKDLAYLAIYCCDDIQCVSELNKKYPPPKPTNHSPKKNKAVQ